MPNRTLIREQGAQEVMVNMVKTGKAIKPKQQAKKPKLLKRVRPLEALEVMTIDEVCELLRLSKRAVYHLITDGKIPALKAGTKYRFYRKAVLEAMSKVEHSSVTGEPKVETQGRKEEDRK